MAKVKTKKTIRERFLGIRNRISDLMKNQSEDIQRGQFLKITGHFVLEAEFLLKIVEFAETNDSDLFQKFAAAQNFEPAPEEDAELGDPVA